MSKVLVTKSSLEDIADAIRVKNGAATTYKPGQMAAAIAALPSSSTLGTKTVTANGTYQASNDNLDGYSSFTVNIASYDSTSF